MPGHTAGRRRLRRRPTISLVVMFILGALWCGSWALLQGETPWEPWDRGWFAAWVFQFLLIGSLLVYLWWHRASAWAIVWAPIGIQVLVFSEWFLLDALGVPSSGGDWEDSSTFVDAIVEMCIPLLVATGVVVSVATLFARSHGRKRVLTN